MENSNISSFESLVKPDILHKQIPSTNEVSALVMRTRREIKDIISGKSRRKLFIVGPCSIHNVEQALDYGKRLKLLADKVRESILIVMRVYFEKPRTTIGWKGLINDPYLNNSFHVNEGLRLARNLLLELNKIGLPCGYEVLDTITPQYISDLISWGAIGARTTESQVHRQMVSGLSMPVGFKNGTDGNKKIARDAVLSAKYNHCFMGITDKGEPAICKTKGNTACHVILRGGSKGPNYYPDDINEMKGLLLEKELTVGIMIDCSHGNSKKNHKNQSLVLDYTVNEMKRGAPIIGIMLESNINEGKQPLGDATSLKYGISITDSCISIAETEMLIGSAFVNLQSVKKQMLKEG